MRWTRDLQRNFFPVPNSVFDLNLSAGEIAVYSYLLRCANRSSQQCWPSYKTIGEAVDMTQNTVRKYVLKLEERGLICTEPTTICTAHHRNQNGNLRYTIRPFQEAQDKYHQGQFEKAALEQAKQEAKRKLQDHFTAKEECPV